MPSASRYGRMTRVIGEEHTADSLDDASDSRQADHPPRVQPRRTRPVWGLVALSAVTMLLGMVQRAPCHAAGWPADYSVLMGKLCYSDIPLLYGNRVFHTGDFPFTVNPGAYETLEY
ncbi:MAG: hypothetical protein ACRDT1_12480, partial [Micromonosporaceae bacterium]